MNAPEADGAPVVADGELVVFGAPIDAPEEDDDENGSLVVLMKWSGMA